MGDSGYMGVPVKDERRTQRKREMDYKNYLGVAAALLGLGTLITASVYTYALTDVKAASRLGDCSCRQSRVLVCSRYDAKFVLSFVSAYQEAVKSSGYKWTFSKTVHSILYNYTSIANAGTIVGISSTEALSIIIEVIQEICNIINNWNIWLAIGVMSIIGGLIGFISGCSLARSGVKAGAIVPGVISVVIAGPPFIMFFYTSALSADLVWNFPMLAGSAIALFVFSIPAGILLVLAIVAGVCYCLAILRCEFE